MNNVQLAKRINDLAKKLKPTAGSSEVLRFDFDSFTDPEKYILLLNLELEQKYGYSMPHQVFVENRELYFKANQILFERTSDLFQFVVPRALMLDEVEQWFFKLHFGLFLKNFKDCLANLNKWSNDEKEEFLCEMNIKPKRRE